MGVICQIYLQRPPDGKYRPGSVVSGTVKYVIDKDTTYKDITVSLIGKGKCSWSESRTDGKTDDTYTGTEDLVSIHTKLLQKKVNLVTLPAGAYSHPFHFIFPSNIPASYKDNVCTIQYQVVLKFERPGLLNFTKTFRTELPVVSTVISTLPEGPIVYGLKKTLFQFFSNQKSIINLKATLAKSLVMPGEHGKLDFEVENNSNVTVTGLKIELMEYLTFKSNCKHTKKSYKKIKNCKAETEPIEIGKIKQLSCIIPTTENCVTLQNSQILSREYKLIVTMRLPVPHINASLEIPIIIGEKVPEIEIAQEVAEDVIPDEPPPSYWEAMAEDVGK